MVSITVVADGTVVSAPSPELLLHAANSSTTSVSGTTSGKEYGRNMRAPQRCLASTPKPHSEHPRSDGQHRPKTRPPISGWVCWFAMMWVVLHAPVGR